MADTTQKKPRKWSDSPWVQDYLKASFRGVEFWVEASEAKVGRRTITHEYPHRDGVDVEDTGRNPRRFRLDAFVLGPNYASERDKLLKEFEAEGEGTLVHPWWDNMTVWVEGEVTVRETTRNGGMVRFSMTMVEKGDLVISPADTQAKVAEAADAVEKAITGEFVAAFDLDALFEALRNSLLGKILEAIAFIQKIKGKIDAAMAMIDEVTAAIDDLADLVVALINLPETLANKFKGAFASIVASVNKVSSALVDDFMDGGFSNQLISATTGIPIDLATATAEEIAAAVAMRDQTETSDERKLDLAMSAFREIIAYGDDLVDAPQTTPTRLAERAAQEAFVRLMHVSTTAETCRVVATLTPPSMDTAMSIQDELAEQIDALAEEDDCDDDVFAAMQDLRAAVVEHFEQAAQELPSIIEYTPTVTLPALVVAHDIYGDATRADEIITRNGIPHPAFVTGGQALEVLSDE